MEKAENKQKIKLLIIIEYLRKETDEENPVTTKNMCAMLARHGIKCDRRTLYQDIELLYQFGFPVGKKYVGHSMGYYYAGSVLNATELRFLFDSIEVAGFLPRERAEALQKKLTLMAEQLGNRPLPTDLLHFNEIKRTDTAVFENVETIGTALEQQKRIGFKYFDLNENQEKIFRKLGRRYLLDPIALIYNEGNYYLTVFSEKYDAFNVYRVDRMAEVQVLPEPVAEKALEMRKGIAAYTAQMFRMFGGESEEVSLRFPDKLLGAVYDKFGLDITVTRLAENILEAESTVQLSPPFYGWVFQFGGEMRITGPAKAVRGYSKAMKKAAEALAETEE